MVATDAAVEPGGYGLGRHGWVALRLQESPGEERWRQVEEWIRTSYTLVAPRKLAKLVIGAAPMRMPATAAFRRPAAACSRPSERWAAQWARISSIWPAWKCRS